MITQRILLTMSLFLVLALGACTEAKPPLTDEALKKMQYPSAALEGPGTQSVAATLREGSGTPMTDHPEVEGAEKLQREVYVPENVQDKWKAVKLLVKNKTSEEKNEVRMITLGSQFELGNGALKITVGPFFPNFVMTKTAYTSMDNALVNPAVQLVVEENGKVIYKGWAFQKYPALYSLEHDAFGLELLEGIPADVS